MSSQSLIWLIITATGIADCVVMLAEGMSIDWATKRVSIAFVLLSFGLSAICRWLRGPEIAQLVIVVAQISAITQVFSVLTYALMAASPYPMADTMFMHADAALGFNWMSWFLWVSAHPVVRLILRYAYGSIPLQLVVLVLFFSYAEAKRVDEFLISGMLALLIICSIMYLLPGVGAWSSHGVGTESWQADVLALRAHSLLKIGLTEGIITFPSFHTVLGVLFIHTARGRKWLLYPLLLLNGLLITSVMSEGAHFFVDLLSGLLVAAVSIAATAYLLRFGPVVRIPKRSRSESVLLGSVRN